MWRWSRCAFRCAFGLSTVAQRLDNYAYDLMSAQARRKLGRRNRWWSASTRRPSKSLAARKPCGRSSRRPSIDLRQARARSWWRSTSSCTTPAVTRRGRRAWTRLCARRPTWSCLATCCPMGAWEDPLPRFAPPDPRHIGHVEWATDRLDAVTRQIPLERSRRVSSAGPCRWWR